MPVAWHHLTNHCKLATIIPCQVIQWTAECIHVLLTCNVTAGHVIWHWMSMGFVYLTKLGMFTVAIFGPFSAHFWLHFWIIFGRRMIRMDWKMTWNMATMNTLKCGKHPENEENKLHCHDLGPGKVWVLITTFYTGKGSHTSHRFCAILSRCEPGFLEHDASVWIFVSLDATNLMCISDGRYETTSSSSSLWFICISGNRSFINARPRRLHQIRSSRLSSHREFTPPNSGLDGVG